MNTQLEKTVHVTASPELNTRETNTELAASLVREYKQTRWAANSERIGKPDSLSARYSIQEMEEFLAIAKLHGADGIKFHYGAFPEYFAPDPIYSGRQTLVMVATKSKTSQLGKSTVKDLYLTKNGKAEILSGLLPVGCPPMCVNEGGTADLGITIVDKGENGMVIV